MTSNFLHLLSSAPCSMSINGNNLGYLDNKNNFEFDIITKSNNVFVSYNPISENNDFLPYTANINCTNIVNCNNKNIQIVPFPNNHWDIYFSPYKYLEENDSELIFSKNIGKYYISISNSNKSTINIFSSSSLLLNKTIEKITSANVDIKKDIIILQGIKNNDQYYILIFDTTNASIIYEDFVQSINISELNIESLKNLKDISHHSLVCKVNCDTKSSQKYYVYENNICANPISFETIPQDFLECLKIGDEAKARSHLHPNLINANIAYFQKYFGDYQKIYLNRHQFLQMKLNYTLIGNNKKNYNFVMENNKIKDIEEIF